MHELIFRGRYLRRIYEFYLRIRFLLNARDVDLVKQDIQYFLGAI